MTAAAEARLLIEGSEFPLTLPRTRMGRYPNNEVVIDHPTVSAYHAEIIRRPDNRHEIVDRESRNGTRVNGALIRSQILKDGDLITLGGSTLHYLNSPAPAQPAYQSPADAGDIYSPGGQTSPVSPPRGMNLPPE
jgi:pSer/pThr/pTyr-binding forkhead associated (FHA) protein